jgi:uncharacterized protein (TIGR02145 family)
MRNRSTVVLSSILPLLVLFMFVSCSKDKPSNPAAQVPILTTAAVSDITPTSARCGGTITSDGGAAVFHRGVCWSTNPLPVYFHDQTYDSTGTGSFTSLISGLTPATHYYFRAYAMNDAGLGYGDTVSFTTLSAANTVTDIDGNVYQTVTIGSQVWMAENLKVTRYRNGDSIPNVTDSISWSVLSTGAYCNYGNDINNVAVYGRLYNWYAGDDSRNIAPEGWHVPTDAEWDTLVNYLGGFSFAGEKMKEMGTNHWDGLNTGATNESGFSALPGGCRDYYGYYVYVGYYANFWSSTEDGSLSAWNRYLFYIYPGAYRGSSSMRIGFSVRCVKD